MYYCYISHDKVNQLISRFSEYEIEELSEKKGKEHNYKGGISFSNILKLIGINISYGRSDLYHKELKLRETMTQKLRRLLTLIKNDIYDLNTENIDNKFFYFNGFLRVSEIDTENNMVIIRGKNTHFNLVLHCSLKYFSSNSNFNEPIQITSTNYTFLKKQEEIEFKVVFLKINKKEETIIGTPLFLLLENEVLNL